MRQARIFIAMWAVSAGMFAQASLTLTASMPNPVAGIVGNTYGAVFVSLSEVRIPVTPRFTATGGTEPYVYTLESGELPSGLVLNPSSGVIQGYPTTTILNGREIMVIRAQDSQGRTARMNWAPIRVEEPPSFLFAAAVGSSFRQPGPACGLAGGTGFVHSAQGLPTGIQLDAASRTVRGEPFSQGTSVGKYWCDNGSVRFQWQFEIRVAAMPEFTMPSAKIGEDYQFDPEGFPSGAATFFRRAGELPQGLQLTGSSGRISGTPSLSGNSVFELRRTDATGAFQTHRFFLLVNPNSNLDPTKLIVENNRIIVRVSEGQTQPAIGAFLVRAGTEQSFRAEYDLSAMLSSSGVDLADIRLRNKDYRTDAVVQFDVDVRRLKAGTKPKVVLNLNKFGQPPEQQLTLEIIVESPTPKLEVTPSAIYESFNQGDSAERVATFTVKNAGGGRLDFSLKSPQVLLGSGWLRFFGLPRQLSGGESYTYAVFLKAGTLEPGTYVAELEVTAVDQPSVTVRISIEVKPPSGSGVLILGGETEVTMVADEDPRTVQILVSASQAGPSDTWVVLTGEDESATPWFKLGSKVTGRPGESFTLTFDPRKVPLQCPTCFGWAESWIFVHVSFADGRGFTNGWVHVSLEVAPYYPPSVSPSLMYLPSRRRTEPGGFDRDFSLTSFWKFESLFQLDPLLYQPVNPTAQLFVRVEPASGLVPASNPFGPPGIELLSTQQFDGVLDRAGLYGAALTVRFRDKNKPNGPEYPVLRRIYQLVGEAGEPVPVTPNSFSAPDAKEPNGKLPLSAESVCTKPGLFVLMDVPPLFRFRLGVPVDLRASVINACGAPVTAGLVVAQFDNGDPELSLLHQGNGVWATQWTPRTPHSVLKISIVAENELGQAKDELEGQLMEPPNGPLLDAEGLRHGASGASLAGVTPGMRVRLNGRRLTLERAEAQSTPGTTAKVLAGTRVRLGDLDLDLLEVTPTSILAIIPTSAAVGEESVLRVIRQDGLSANWGEVPVFPADPGILTVDGTGTGQGSIFTLRAANRVLASSTQGAGAGESVAIEVSGLGTRNLLGNTATPLRVLLGDAALAVAPYRVSPTAGKPGVFDVVFLVPSARPTGTAMKVIVDAGGFRSAPVTMSLVSSTASCVVGIAPVQLRVPSAGGTTPFNVTAPAGCAWTLSSSAAWITASPTSGTGNATVSVQAAANTGVRRTSALSFSGLSVNVEQASQAEPAITGVVNGALFTPGISSGMWISILGQNLSGTTRSWTGADFAGNRLPTVLDGVGVKVNGLDAFPAFISPQQLNVLVPQDATLGLVDVEVTRNGVPSFTFQAERKELTPGLFRYGVEGGRYLAAVHVDGAFVTRDGLFPGAFTRAAAPGDSVAFYGTGCGPTNPLVTVDRLLAAPANLAKTVNATVGGVPAAVSYAGIVSSGLCQVNVVMPSVASGDQEVLLTIGGVSAGTGGFVTIK